MFLALKEKIRELSELDFIDASRRLNHYIDNLDEIVPIIKEIGAIPEDIVPSSTEEKLYSKASDMVLSRAFREIGLKSVVLDERSNSADVIAESKYHDYSLVADAKAFRLSRTAKNQKDYKVNALSGWRKDSEYAVLAAPLYQYPTTTSQIYGQALDNNVCLFSWEFFIYLMENNYKETEETNFSIFWNFSDVLSEKTLVSKKNQNFFDEFINLIIDFVGEDEKVTYEEVKKQQIEVLKDAGALGIAYWQEEIEKIKAYSKEEAINELIKASKIDNKIVVIEKLVRSYIIE